MSSAGSLMSSIGGGRCTASCGRSSPTASQTGMHLQIRARPRPAGLADPLPRDGPPPFSVIRCMRAPTATGSGRRGAVRQIPGHRGAAGRRAGSRGLPGVPEGSLPGVHHLRAIRGEQRRLAANRSRAESPGTSATAAACWPGWSGAGGAGGGCTCGTGGPIGGRPTSASTLRSDYGLPLCQAVTAAEVEAWLAEQVLEVLQPAALEASLGTAAEVEQRRRDGLRHWEQRLEQARYEADRAARQYQACEPENRLVARTVERRWEEAVQAVQRLEADFDRFVRSQPRLVAQPARTNTSAGRGSAGTVAGPDNGAGGPEAGRPAAGGPCGADRQPGR